MTRPQNTSEIVHSYARDVVGGEVIAGPHVRAACQRHLDDMDSGSDRGLWFDAEAADRALEFFPDVLRLNGGQFEGIPFHLHPAQAFIVGSIFGWKMSDGTRRFQKAYIEQGKGNGKSPLAGGIGLYTMLADGEAGAEVYSAAAKLDQAKILFRDAVSMVQQSPALSARLSLSGKNPVHTISFLPKGSFFKPVGRDTGKTGSGMRPHGVLIDELHEHPTRDTVEMLERGFKSRRNPLLFMITNSGSDRNSYCYEWHEAAVHAAHRSHDPADLGSMDRIYSYVCALDKGDDPLEIGENGELPVDVWRKANPLLGVTLTEEYLAGVAADARAVPGKANAIRRLHFCEWTDAESAWMSRETWEAAEDVCLSLDGFEAELSASGDDRRAWLALDLGATKDFTALAMIFPDGKDDEDQQKYVLFGHAFTPADTVTQRAKEDKAPYLEWIKDGHVTATPGKVVRNDFIAAHIADLAERFSIEALVYDRWLFNRFEETLNEHNLDLPLLEHPQGFKRREDTGLWMPGSVDALETLLLEGRLRVAVNPALRSAVASATFVTSPSGLRRFDKQKATSRIDLAVAAAMACGAASEGAEEAISPSYMESSGLVII